MKKEIEMSAHTAPVKKVSHVRMSKKDATASARKRWPRLVEWLEDNGHTFTPNKTLYDVTTAKGNAMKASLFLEDLNAVVVVDHAQFMDGTFNNFEEMRGNVQSMMAQIKTTIFASAEGNASAYRLHLLRLSENVIPECGEVLGKFVEEVRRASCRRSVVWCRPQEEYAQIDIHE